MRSTIAQQRAAAGKVCVYCAEPRLTGDQRPEHPIPAAIGSSWQVFTVCDRCNDWADVHVDQPFLDDDFILELRSSHDIRDQRHGTGRRVASPFSRGHTPEGLYVVADEEWQQPHVRGRILEGSGENEFRIVAGDEEEYQRLLKKLELRAAALGKTLELGEPEIVHDHPRVTGRLVVRPWRWRRLFAKIALAAGSVAYDKDWHTSSDAQQLRHWMRDKDALPYDHCPLERVAGSAIEPLVEPAHHVVCFLPGAAATQLAVVLFGEYCLRLPIDTAGRSRPVVAWDLDPHRPRVHGETTWNGLLSAMLKRRFSEDFEAA
jgi:hypothetical protein